MFTEREFVRSFSSFWKDTLPFCEMYVRHLNANYVDVYAREFVSNSAPSRRALVNELAFEIFTSALVEGGVNEVVGTAERMGQLYALTIEKMRRFEGFGLPQGPLTFVEQSEAIKLARRVFQFFARFEERPQARPPFPGCGMLGGAEGDVLVEQTLFEVKAGDRGYRGIDLRQLLTYCALNHVGGQHDIQHVGLVNPRTGTYFRESIGTLCVRLSGEPMEFVLGRIRSFLAGTLASP